MEKQEEFKKTEFMSEGLRLTILGCFRYSLGRRTYMPSHTVGIIKQHPDIFTKDDWKRFIEEIDKYKIFPQYIKLKARNEDEN